MPYGTMFKLCPPRPGEARHLECVACGTVVEWRIYTVAPRKFDEQCPSCLRKAKDYWKGKLHKEIDDA